MKRATASLLCALLGAAPAWADPAVPVPDGYHMEPYRSPVPDTVPGASVVHSADLMVLVSTGRAQPIDVLPAPRRPESMRPDMPWLPQSHIAISGSLWWPEAGLGVLPAQAESLMRQRLAALPPDRLIVFYCRADCWLSWNAARRAAAMGFTVAWYPDGIEAWSAAGLLTEAIKPDPLE